MKPTLYGQATSSCSFRIRIALNLAGIQCEHIAVSNRRRKDAKYLSLNPQGLVPLLVVGQDRISQSMAIFEYLSEEMHVDSLLPKDAAGRARARSIAQFVICEIQPLQNTRIDKYLADEHINELAWKRHWIKEGLANIETMLASDLTGKYCHGDVPTLADCCVIPQVYNALSRYGLTVDDYPTIARIYEEAKRNPAFQAAWPDKQEDFGQE